MKEVHIWVARLGRMFLVAGPSLNFFCASSPAQGEQLCPLPWSSIPLWYCQLPLSRTFETHSHLKSFFWMLRPVGK